MALAHNKLNQILEKLRVLGIKKGLCFWKLENGKKVPYSVSFRPQKADITEYHGTTIDDIEGRIKEKSSLLNEIDGIGIILQDKSLVVIDIDSCLTEDGTLPPDITHLMATYPTYVEKSPSGKGIHLLFRTSGGISLPKTRYALKDSGRLVEVYYQKRYITFTGDQLPGTPTKLAQAADEVCKSFATNSTGSTGGGILPQAPPVQRAGLTLTPEAEPPKEKFEALMEIEKFRQTWEVRRTEPKFQKADGSPDWSSYDLSLATQALRKGWFEQEVANLIIAFRRYHNANPEKALRLDYITMTLEQAKPARSLHIPQDLYRDGGQPEPQFFTPGDIQDVEPPPFIFEGLIPKGSLVLLAGQEKIGKSWFCLQLACSLSHGEKFLKRSSSSMDVYYYALEDSPSRLNSRLQKLGWKDLSMPKFSLNPPDLSDLKSLPDGSVVIIDTLALSQFYLRDKGNTRGNAYEKDVRVITELKTIVQEKQLTVIVVTHMRKDKSSKDPIDQITGSKGLPATVDVILTLHKTRPYAPLTELHYRGRDIGSGIMILNFEDGKWTRIADAMDNLTQKEMEVLLEITKNPNITDKDLALKLDMTESTLRTHRAKLNRKILKA